MKKATIVIPTTKDRGPLLPFSVGSVLNQTESDLEVFIIGDGVDDRTREVINDLKKQDPRVLFFDNPKGPRRGEIYRHQALINRAQSQITCYLLDRDLMLPNHVANMLDNLAESNNFCISAGINVDQEHRLTILRQQLGSGLRKGDGNQFIDHGSFRFSTVGHTNELYQGLPFGWRTTPKDMATDRYMWLQMIETPRCSIASIPDLTILYFKRGNHPGLPATERARELAKFYPMLSRPQDIELLKKEALANLMNNFDLLKRQTVLIKGHHPRELPAAIWKEILSRYSRNW